MSAENIQELIDGLSADDWQARQDAAAALGNLGPVAKDALGALMNTALRDEDVDVRQAARQALLSIAEDKPSLVPVLLQSLGDSNWDVRLTAAEFLVALGPEAKEALETLHSELLTADDYSLRTTIARAIVAIEEDQAKLLSDSLALLASGDGRQVRSGAELLGAMELSDADKQKALDALWKSLGQIDEITFVEPIFLAITRITSDQAAVIQRLADPDTPIDRWKQSLFVLSPVVRDGLATEWRTDSESILPLIVGALEDDQQFLREEASDWLAAKSGDIPADSRDAVLDALRRCVQDYGQGIQAIDSLGVDDSELDQLMEAAQPALVFRKIPEALERRWARDRAGALRLILEALWDDDWVTRKDAVGWLGKKAGDIRGEQLARVVEELQDLQSRESDRDVLGSVSRALDRLLQRKMDTPEGWRKTLRTGREDERIDTITYLVQTGTPMELAVLIDVWIEWIATGDKPALVRTAAEQMRFSGEAVSLLVDQLEKEWRPSKELKAEILKKAPPEYSLLKNVLNGERLDDAENDQLEDWLTSLADRSDEFARLRSEKRTKEMVAWFEGEELKSRELLIHRRIAKQLADMSDFQRFYEEIWTWDEYDGYIKTQLEKHAVPVLGRRLLREGDVDMRANMARTLGNLSGREAVEALAQAMIGEERKLERRQGLLDEYYLKPSRARGEEAAQMLKRALDEARTTLWILRVLNITLFSVGLFAIVVGLVMILQGSTERATQIAGFFATIGGVAGVLSVLIRDPLDRIQNAMANLVQLEAAFTSFVWELNLNSTYIQSQYIAKGELSDKDISETVGRIESAMSLALALVQTYTEQGGQRIVTRLHSLSPVSDRVEKNITIHGQNLRGDSLEKKKHEGSVLINHTPLQVEDVSWRENEVRFKLPAKLPGLEQGEGKIMVSLFIDGMETNALPFYVVKEVSQQE